MNGRRSEVEIIAEILKLAENGAKQTAIMYGCNLNHGRVRGYLGTLETKGLLECRRNDPEDGAASPTSAVWGLQKVGSFFFHAWISLTEGRP